MKIAYAHCWLLPGGAKNVLEDIIQKTHSDNCCIFTLVSKDSYLTVDKKQIPVKTILPRLINKSILWITDKNIPILSSLFDYRNLIIFAPIRSYLISRQIKKYNPDYIYISSFAWTKNLNSYGVPTTAYIHSPMQYIWTHKDEYREKIQGWKGRLFKKMIPILQKRDRQKRTYKKTIANSIYTAQQIKKIYKLQADIYYPSIDNCIIQQPITQETHDYFVYVGRLVTFVKEVDKIIQACNQTKTQLIIIGDGPDKEKLQKIAGDTILFVPWIQNIHDRIQIMQQAKGLINITKESFGISTMEALLLGVPVLGYNDGASVELVDKGSGILIENKDSETINKAIQERDQHIFDRKTIQKKAQALYNTQRKEVRQ